MIGAKRHAKGFTLVELLITTTLFILSATVLTDIFSSFYVIHRKVANQAAISQEMRFATEFLVRQIRQKNLAYPALPGAFASKLDRLDLVSDDGTTISIGLQTGANCQTTVAGVQCLAVSQDGGTSWSPLTGGRINVTRFDVYPRPLKNPFELVAGGYDNNIQPMVTLVLGLAYLADNPKDNIALNAQTTVAIRQYVR